MKTQLKGHVSATIWALDGHCSSKMCYFCMYVHLIFYQIYKIVNINMLLLCLTEQTRRLSWKSIQVRDMADILFFRRSLCPDNSSETIKNNKLKFQRLFTMYSLHVVLIWDVGRKALLSENWRHIDIGFFETIF